MTQCLTRKKGKIEKLNEKCRVDGISSSGWAAIYYIKHFS